jgi:hypothetical protein
VRTEDFPAPVSPITLWIVLSHYKCASLRSGFDYDPPEDLLV